MREHDYRTQLLQGKVALITGASRGIGAATAKLFAKHGAIVGINYHTSAAQAGKIVESICAEGGHAIAFRANVNDAEQVEAMVEQVERDLGPIDILVLNAMATASKSKPVATSKEENLSPFIPFLESEWDLYHNVVVSALAGVYLPARSVVPFMAERKRGNVIAISSLVARLAYPGTGALAAGKASVEAFMRVLATELGPYQYFKDKRKCLRMPYHCVASHNPRISPERFFCWQPMALGISQATTLLLVGALTCPDNSAE